MRKALSTCALLALLAAIPLPVQAGKGGSGFNYGGNINLSVDNFRFLGTNSDTSKRLFNSVVTDVSFGNVLGEYDRAFSAADSHSVWGTGYNRHLGAKDPGESGRRPFSLYTGLGTFQDANDGHMFSVGASAGAGDNGVWGVALLTRQNSSSFSDDGPFSVDPTEIDTDFTQFTLNYGRFVGDGKAFIGGKLCFNQFESEREIDGTTFIDQGLDSDLLELDLAVKLIQDDGYLTFGLGYGMADINRFDNDLDTGTDTFDDTQAVLQRTGYGLSVRYTNYWSDNEDFEWEIAGGLDMHEIEVDDRLFAMETAGLVDTTVITADDLTIDTYSLRGTILQHIGSDVDLYYTASLWQTEFDGMLSWEDLTDGTVIETTDERSSDEDFNFGLNLSGRYFFKNGKTSLLAGFTWDRNDSDSDFRREIDGSVSSEFSNGNTDQDLEYAFGVSHVLNERFRFDLGFEDTDTQIGGQGPSVDNDEFRFSLIGTF